MANLLADIQAAVDGSAVEALVVGTFANPKNVFAPEDTGVVLDWDDYAQYLDYEYDPEVASDAHPIYLWTDLYVIVVVTGPFGTYIGRVHRNPEDVIPGYVGLES